MKDVKRKSIKQNNTGFSLVEVIVSMLILALLVTPLLKSFVTSAKANQSAKLNQYATNVAQNTLEGMKFYGLESTARQMNGETEQFYLLPESSIKGEYYETDAEGSKISDSVDHDGNFTEKDSKIYYFRIDGVEEGVSLFDVQITCDANEFFENSGKQNRYVMPDLSDLDVRNAALINPNAYLIESTYDPIRGYMIDWEISQTYDDRAKFYFKEKHEQHIDYLNQFIEEDDPLLSYADIDIIFQDVSRTTIIYLNQEGEKYTVDCKMEYCLSDEEGFYIYNESDRTVVFEDAYMKKSFDELKGVYLFYMPFDKDADTIIVHNEIIDMGEGIHVYIAKQESMPEYINYNKKIYVDVIPEDSETDVIFYSNIFLEQVNEFSYPLTENVNYYLDQLVEDLPLYDRIYHVKVEIYQSGTGKKLVELTSTISN